MKVIKREEVYKIGKLGKTHGVSGELSFLFEDDVFDSVDADFLILDIDGILVPFFIESCKDPGFKMFKSFRSTNFHIFHPNSTGQACLSG